MRKTFLLAAAMFAGTVLAPAASAQISISSFTWNPTVVNVGSLYYNNSPIRSNLGAGRIALTGTENGHSVNMFTYCVDLFQNLHAGTFTRAQMSVVLPDPIKQGQLLALLEHSNDLLAGEPDVNNQIVIAAATQLAVWDIVYEPGALSATSGVVKTVSGGTFAPQARSLANVYLTKISNLSWVASATKRLVLLYAKDNQSQVLLTSVPEPSTWAMLIAGVGMMGGVLRRKRREDVQAANAA